MCKFTVIIKSGPSPSHSTDFQWLRLLSRLLQTIPVTCQQSHISRWRIRRQASPLSTDQPMLHPLSYGTENRKCRIAEQSQKCSCTDRPPVSGGEGSGGPLSRTFEIIHFLYTPKISSRCDLIDYVQCFSNSNAFLNHLDNVFLAVPSLSEFGFLLVRIFECQIVFFFVKWQWHSPYENLLAFHCKTRNFSIMSFASYLSKVD